MLTSNELDIITVEINKKFKEVSSLYSFKKYPAGNYKLFKSSFSSRSIKNDAIETAMIWKWGHTGKSNYPSSHKKLISEISSFWKDYIENPREVSPQNTFLFWKNALEKNTRYITVAYITHLIHHKEIPIIDQHNFRAMNDFIKLVRPVYISKKKPSNWKDILDLKYFIEEISRRLNYSTEEVDRFLMMYGRYFAKR